MTLCRGLGPDIWPIASSSRHNRGLDLTQTWNGVTLDYRVDFAGEETISAAWFQAADDKAAFMRALALYKARAVGKGFTLWERNRLVYAEPAEAASLVPTAG